MELELQHGCDSRNDPEEEAKAVELLLQSCPLLQDLRLEFSLLNARLAHSLAQHPSLSSLSLRLTRITRSTALTSIISESRFISSFTLEFDYSSRPVSVPLECLQRNVHLLNTNLFDYCDEIDVTQRPQLQHRYESRNHRLLHNWRCICVLLASYRANAHSRIRDSMLSLMVDVMSFLVPDEWYVERLRY
jgi:hypothetical protein